jgi:hypothetical protein
MTLTTDILTLIVAEKALAELCRVALKEPAQ